jgi:hypothetical protein
MMRLLTISALVLPALAAPLAKNTTLSMLQPRGCTLGAMVCNGPSQFAICGPGGKLTWEPVAAGMSCINGQYVKGGSNAPAASAAPATTAAPSSSAAPPPSSSHPAPSSSAPPASSAAPAAPSSSDTSYKMFNGDGSVSQGWPAQSIWPSFDDLWAVNTPTLSASCTQFGTANNSPQELSDLKTAIQNVGKSTSVDPRMILAIMMQESKGCVRVWTTKYSVANPGLFQSHEGTGTCNTGISNGGPPFPPGQISNPCPPSQINQMVQDGIAGTSSGAGIQKLMAATPGNDVNRYYRAARMYNSGSIAADGDLSSPQSVATKCYASDVANRLLGFVGNTGCTLDKTS